MGAAFFTHANEKIGNLGSCPRLPQGGCRANCPPRRCHLPVLLPQFLSSGVRFAPDSLFPSLWPGALESRCLSGSHCGKGEYYASSPGIRATRGPGAQGISLRGRPHVSSPGLWRGGGGRGVTVWTDPAKKDVLHVMYFKHVMILVTTHNLVYMQHIHTLHFFYLAKWTVRAIVSVHICKMWILLHNTAP